MNRRITVWPNEKEFLEDSCLKIGVIVMDWIGSPRGAKGVVMVKAADGLYRVTIELVAPAETEG